MTAHFVYTALLAGVVLALPSIDPPADYAARHRHLPVRATWRAGTWIAKATAALVVVIVGLAPWWAALSAVGLFGVLYAWARARRLR